MGHLSFARQSLSIPFSGLGAAKPVLRFYADASAAPPSVLQRLYGRKKIELLWIATAFAVTVARCRLTNCCVPGVSPAMSA
jgi:hypothetical protein